MAERPVRHKGAQPPAKTRTCMEFLDYWQPRVRNVTIDVELDFSWRDHAITITDMRVPSALRTGVLYTQQEVEEGADRVEGDMDRRVNQFLTQAARQH